MEAVLHIIGSISSQTQTVTVAALKNSMEWAAAGVDVNDALRHLANSGYVFLTADNRITLTKKGSMEAERIREKKIQDEFDCLIDRCTQSSAYLDFCEELYGHRLYLFNMMDKRQLDDLFADLSVSKESTVLDMGCGTGSLLNRIVQNTGCKGAGIDRLDGSIVKRLSPLIEYRQMNMDEVQVFDAQTVLFVDSVYFSSDLRKLIGGFKGKPVKAYIYFSMYLFEETDDNTIPDADYTQLAGVLNELGMAYKTIDYSECEYQLYQRGIKLLAKYEARFAEQGIDDIYERRLKEFEFGARLFEQGRATRFLYIAEGL